MGVRHPTPPPPPAVGTNRLVTAWDHRAGYVNGAGQALVAQSSIPTPTPKEILGSMTLLWCGGPKSV